MKTIYTDHERFWDYVAKVANSGFVSSEYGTVKGSYSTVVYNAGTIVDNVDDGVPHRVTFDPAQFITVGELLDELNEAAKALKGKRFESGPEFHHLVKGILTGNDTLVNSDGFDLFYTMWDLHVIGRKPFLCYDRDGTVDDKRFKWEWKGRIDCVTFRLFDRESQDNLKASDFVTPDMTVAEAVKALGRAYKCRALAREEEYLALVREDVAQSEARIAKLKEELQ